jgi:molybdopterin-guanine dinucleotide biosynthesis protein A
MGGDKALLPFGNATMLERVAATVESSMPTQRILVLAAANQELPLSKLTILRDSTKYQGPLVAIAKGLAVLSDRVEAAFVTGCDTPLLLASVIGFLFDQLGNHDCVMLGDVERIYPLCGVYRCSIYSKIQAFKGRSLHEFIATLDAHIVPCEKLRVVDPELISLRNVNTRDDYLAALAVDGLTTP